MTHIRHVIWLLSSTSVHQREYPYNIEEDVRNLPLSLIDQSRMGPHSNTGIYQVKISQEKRCRILLYVYCEVAVIGYFAGYIADHYYYGSRVLCVLMGISLSQMGGGIMGFRFDCLVCGTWSSFSLDGWVFVFRRIGLVAPSLKRIFLKRSRWCVIVVILCG